ncbi:hypothetical protein MBM_01670 [Drepanopeziza brunnea f. sp. 'multigermtubi' MB_m1]|uniref:Hydrophobin n=1 Tax=Marssonina brunnea f. sp. multigermtubi (strain MB_m1) TaxID=1072389 RepID=K1XFY8_MARBU|nr:uncharacterized protein MBM_01670 [Drepanopeziza brunnea f. sp. 'multigermtubi' MB_m1]EKD19718.1 hypothetical protein MBM_01670 [Drepanopeziza brunnea f. sp. 'multigermtubi' MB_m1]
MSFPNFITCFAVALLLVVATATATAIASPDSLPYLVSELLITGTIDEIPFDLTGTIQQVEVQYVKPAIAIPCFSECLFGLTCIPIANWDWKKAVATAIKDGVNSLNNIDAAGCRVNALTCARVSCSYDSAIHLCNDNVSVSFNDILYPFQTLSA